MEQFPHLNFVQKITGKHRFFGGGSANERTNTNKLNRHEHSTDLFQKTSKLRQDWIDCNWQLTLQRFSQLRMQRFWQQGIHNSG